MKDKIKNAIEEGLKAVGTGPRCGCGRAYVSLSKVDRKTLNAYKAAAKELGLLYLSEAYGAGRRCIYVGYDNATGVPLARAEEIAKNLRALGLPAYDEAVAD
jgi:hypothetical protein